MPEYANVLSYTEGPRLTMTTYAWYVTWAETREQRIARYHREGLIHYRKDGQLDMRYEASKFIADPKAGMLIWPKQA